MSQPIEDLDEVLKNHKLSKEEYEDILRILDGRHPNIVEIGIFSAMWSEHCSYKSSTKDRVKMQELSISVTVWLPSLRWRVITTLRL